MDDSSGDIGPDPAQTARRREQRYWAVLLGVILLGGLGAAVFTLTAGEGRPAPGRALLVVVLTVALTLVAVVLALAFVTWRRARGSVGFARSPLWELPARRERSRLLKALRRGDPIPPALHDLAERTARAVVGRRWLTWLCIASAALYSWNAVLQHGWLLAFGLVEAAAMLALAGYHTWWLGRMRAALARLESGERPDAPG